jgi:excisionase family DNA binding protein
MLSLTARVRREGRHQVSRFPDLEEARREVETRPTIDVYTAARLLGVGELTVRRAVDSGQLRAVKLGRNIRVVSAGVRELLGLGPTRAEEEP